MLERVKGKYRRGGWWLIRCCSLSVGYLRERRERRERRQRTSRESGA